MDMLPSMPSFVMNEKYELEWLERPQEGQGLDVWLFEKLALQGLESSVYPRLQLPATSPRIPEYASLLAFWRKQEERENISSLKAFHAEMEAFFEEVLSSKLELSLDLKLQVFNFPTPTCTYDFGSDTQTGYPGHSFLFKVPKTHCSLSSKEDRLRFWVEYTGEEIPFEALCDYFRVQATAEFHEVRMERIFEELWRMRVLTGLRLSASYAENSLPDCILVRQKGALQ